ncbi:MAG: hypothetical protein JWR11_2983 [Mycobacterium sp.]|nr:hypothetical protein [Mycobacterium sp.]
MGGEFSLDDVGLTPLADTHSQVAEGLSRLVVAGGPQAAAAATSFGNIAFAVNNALDGVTQARANTVQTTKSASDAIKDLLTTADKMYAEGDREGAAKVRAAAETLEGSASAGGSGAGAGGGGAEVAGQTAGQVGQQVGQLAQGLAQGLAQSVQGLVQGLTQLPQQIMQGVQGAAGSADKGSSSHGASANEDKAAEPEERRRQEAAEADAAEKRAEEQRAQRHSPTAQAGQGADGGRGPGPPPAAERPQPAQTRPQQSSL